jgi:hypothetical protein
VIVPAHKLYEPADYLPEIHAWIESGKTLRAYCRQKGKPSYGLVYDWLEEDAKTEAKTESSRFAHARDLGEEQILQECLEIADSTQVGEIVTTKPVVFEGNVLRDKTGAVILQTEKKMADMIEHRKLRIETRLKLLAKWNPKKYGDNSRVDLNVTDTLAESIAAARKRIEP